MSSLESNQPRVRQFAEPARVRTALERASILSVLLGSLAFACCFNLVPARSQETAQPGKPLKNEPSANDPGEEVVGERGDLDRLDFEGVSTFKREDLRNALAQNTAFLLASHPQAPMKPFLETLRQKVLAGYQQNGFPDATVTTAFNDASGRVRLQINEGVRYRCGKVQVTGTKDELAAAIVARLTKPTAPASVIAQAVQSHLQAATSGDQDQAKGHVKTEAHLNLEAKDPRKALAASRESSNDQPLWTPGEPAAFGESATNQIEEAVKDCLAEYGLFFPQIRSTIKVNPETSTAELLIEVVDEGPHGTVSELEVTGNQKNTSAEILKFLGLKRGMMITRSRVAEAEQRLWRSGRFLGYEITPEPARTGLNKPTSVRLSIKVREYDAVPKLTEKLSGDQQALLTLCDWVSAFDSRAEDLASSVIAQGDTFGIRVELIISPSQGALIKLKETGNGAGLDYNLLFARKTLGWYSPQHGCKLLVNEPGLTSEVMLNLVPNPADPQHPFNFTAGAGWRHLANDDPRLAVAPPFRLDLKLAPAAFLHFLDATNLARQMNGKILSLVSSNQALRFDTKTGRLEELRIYTPQVSAEVRFAKGAFDKARRELDAAGAELSNRYDPEHPLSSMLGYAAIEVARWRLLDQVVTNLTPRQRQRAVAAANQLLSTSVLAPIDQLMSTTNQGEPFFIPSDQADQALAQNSLSAFFGALAFRYCNTFFPKYSWPWTVARESVFVLANRATYTEAELQRLYESDQTGPIGCLAIAELLSKMNLSAPARTFAVRGLTRLTPADFRGDCTLFLEGDSRLAHAFSNMTVALREMPVEDVDSLAAALPPDEAALLQDFAGALRANPGEPPSVTLGPALDKYWTNSLRTRVRTALQKVSAAAPAHAPAGI